MAAAYIGSIPEYDPDTHKWDIYMERVNTFFEANDIKEAAKKRAILLTSIGDKGYTTLRNLTAPTLPTATTWDEIQCLKKEYYTPPSNPIVEQCKFQERNRHQGRRSLST